MYIQYAEYTQLYGPMEDSTFKLLAIEASRFMENHTTGIDGVKKLNRFFPEIESDLLAVTHCAGQLIHTLDQIRQAEQAHSYEVTEQGLRGKIVSSLSSGNESISYSTGGITTEIDAAVKDRHSRNRLLSGIVRDCLRGASDRNGVNLLYMGPYPRRYLV